MSDFITIGKRYPWRYRKGSPPTFDLSRGGQHVSIQAESSEIWVDPTKTALIIIDMVNAFLSPAVGRDPAGPGNAAMKKLVELVPEVRDAGMQVIWCNWGVTQEDIDEMPPSLLKGFGYLNSIKENVEGDPLKSPPRVFRGFGSDMGTVIVDGEEVDAGKMLMPDQWNTALPPDLERVRDRDKDSWAHKNRMSGLWHSNTPLYKLLVEKGLRTLLFAGVNTDQCVQGTLIDADNSDWDVILVKDATGTLTPHGQEVTERNTGFVVSSEEVRRGIRAGVVAE